MLSAWQLGFFFFVFFSSQGVIFSSGGTKVQFFIMDINLICSNYPAGTAKKKKKKSWWGEQSCHYGNSQDLQQQLFTIRSHGLFHNDKSLKSRQVSKTKTLCLFPQSLEDYRALTNHYNYNRENTRALFWSCCKKWKAVSWAAWQCCLLLWPKISKMP